VHGRQFLRGHQCTAAALVEGIPFLGAGIGALSAALTANEDRNVMMRCQSVARLARSGAELDMLIDALARKLTLLQWNLLTSDRALQEEVLKPGFRAWAKAKLGDLAARAVIFAQVNVKGFRALNEAETKAFADVEYVLDLVAKGKLDPKCEPHIEADPLWRGQEIALRMAKEILPGRASYEDVLPSPTEEERIATEKLMAAQTATTTTPNQGGRMDWPVSPLVLPRPGLSEIDLSKLMRSNSSSNNSSNNGVGGAALPSPSSSTSSGDATPNSIWQRSPSVVDPAAAAAAAAELAAVKAEASRAKELADRLALDNERKAEEVRAAAERLAKAEAQLKFVQAEQEAARQAESAKAEQDAKHRAEVKRQFAEQAKILKALSKDKADSVVDGGEQAMMSAAVNPQNHRRCSVVKGSLPDVVLFRMESRVDDQSVRLERMARFLEELGYREKQEQQEEKQREHDKRELFRRKKRAAADADDDEDGGEMGGGGVVGV
jgi:hypothetical protein